MSQPKKILNKDGTTAWIAYVRQGGRGSKAIKRRFSSYKLALDFVEQFNKDKKEIFEGTVEVGTFYGTTFKVEADEWLQYRSLRSSPGYFRRCKDNLDDFCRNYGNLEPNKVTLDFLGKLQGELKQRPGKKKNSTWSNASVNRYTESICAVLNYSAKHRRIPFSPVFGFEKLPKNSPEMLFWDEEEAKKFLTWTNNKYQDWNSKSKFSARKNYIAYLLALNTGMRAGEIWGLKPCDFFFDKSDEGDTLFVRRQFNSILKDFAPLKGESASDKDKSRHVPCPKQLREALESLVRHNHVKEDEPVFRGRDNRPMNHDAFADRFERDAEASGCRRIRFHDLRHTAATLMLSQGIDVKTVKEILGHEDLTTTMNYVHLLGKKIQQVSRTFSVDPAKSERARLQLVQP